MSLIVVDEKYPTKAPNDLEQMLSEYVERARRGTLKAVAIAAVNDDGSIGSAWHLDGQDSWALVASVAKLQRRLNARLLGEE